MDERRAPALQKIRGGAVDILHDALGVRRDHCLRHRAERDDQAFFFRRQRSLGLPAGANVGNHTDQRPFPRADPGNRHLLVKPVRPTLPGGAEFLLVARGAGADGRRAADVHRRHLGHVQFAPHQARMFRRMAAEQLLVKDRLRDEQIPVEDPPFVLIHAGLPEQAVCAGQNLPQLRFACPMSLLGFVPRRHIDQHADQIPLVGSDGRDRHLFVEPQRPLRSNQAEFLLVTGRPR